MYEILKTFPYWLQVIIILFPAISLTIAAFAFALNVRQAILSNSLTRSRIVSDSLHTFMDDETIQTAFYKTEYNVFKYGSVFHGSKEEKEIDKLLRHFSNLAMMWKNGLLTLSDIRPIQYYILRTVNNSEIKKYLAYIDGWSKRSGTGSHPYLELRELCKNLNRRIKPNNEGTKGSDQAKLLM